MTAAPAQTAVAGHFGEWLQGRLGPGGPLVLVTLACPALHATARFAPAARLTLSQPDPPALPEPRLIRLLAALGLPATGRFRLGGTLMPGAGCGASTAALVAAARAAGHAGDLSAPRLAAPRLAAACLAAEGATDPLMLPSPDAALWASREARSLAALPPPPRMTVVGGLFGPPLRTDPRDLSFPDIADLAQDWPGARTPAEAARLASASAERTTALRGPAGDPTPALARSLGALGHARAHTGSARALLFAPGTVPPDAEAALAAAGYAHVLSFETGGA